VAGDYNRNGKVDASDYVVWRKNQGRIVPGGTSADGNQNGAVGPDDYSAWTAGFGQHGPAIQAGKATPYWEVPALKLIDFITYTRQTSEVSQGRLPNGGSTYQYFNVPTPGAANGVTPALGAQMPASDSSTSDNLEYNLVGRDAFFERVGFGPARRMAASSAQRINETSASESLLLVTTMGAIDDVVAESKTRDDSPRASEDGTHQGAVDEPSSADGAWTML
jgi:hypothetical protein